MSAPGPRVVRVTPQQRAVIGELTRDGADNATIAMRLYITEDTVKTHLKRAMARVGADNRTHLVTLLLRGHVALETVRGVRGPRRRGAE